MRPKTYQPIMRLLRINHSPGRVSARRPASATADPPRTGEICHDQANGILQATENAELRAWGAHTKNLTCIAPCGARSHDRWLLSDYEKRGLENWYESSRNFRSPGSRKAPYRSAGY